MLRKTVLAPALLYFVALAAFAALLFQGRPAATGVTEIGFGEWQSDAGFVYISGRRLACAPLAGDDPFTTRCTVPIQGSLLTVKVRPVTLRPGHFAGRCAAEYRGHHYPCRPDLHRGTVRPIALIEGSLGLSAPQREALRDQYWVENGRFPSPYLLALLSALVALAAIIARHPPSPQNRTRRAAAYTAIASLTFVFSCLLLFTVTHYLWN